MPWWILKQPNGTYGRFSTVVDDFTGMNMDREEALGECVNRLGRIGAGEKMHRADHEFPTTLSEPAGRFDGRPEDRPPLSRWNEAIQCMRDLRKITEAEERIGADADWPASPAPVAAPPKEE